MTQPSTSQVRQWFWRGLLACGLFLMQALVMPVAAQAASALFITTSNVPGGKFHALSEIAKPYGIDVKVQYLEELPANVGSDIFRGHDIVFIDTYQVDRVQARLVKALESVPVPLAWLYDKAAQGVNMPQESAVRLSQYYWNGGKENFTVFFEATSALLKGEPISRFPEPIQYPDAAIYHPDAPQLFTGPLEYLQWKGVDREQRPPVIGIAFHQQYVSGLQTRVVDDIIARVEAAGAVPLAFYHATSDDTANATMMAPGGKRVVDALINTRITLTTEAPRKEFEALGIPVVQATPYRRGDAAEWAADPQGLQLMDVPFYMSQSEYVGMVDIQVASAFDNASQELTAIGPQMDAVVNKAVNLVALQRKPNAAKAVTVFFWNYPSGEKNFSASFMNTPQSMRTMLQALEQAGYDTSVPSEEDLVASLQRLLAPQYRNGELQGLLDDGLADRLPVARYVEWLDSLPAHIKRDVSARWGEPTDSNMVLQQDGESWFVIPRFKLGNVVLMPQPQRSARDEDQEKALYHSSSSLPTHFYLAAYLWARESNQSDAFVHFGTHGSQEWLPGKERGLSVNDYPMLAVGDVPVVYPYIADNIGEAQQARRRGRAVIISHQPPPFQPSGLHEALLTMHDLLHDWMSQGEGAVRDQIKADLLALAAEQRIDKDLGWTPERASAEFAEFVDVLHIHLHELAQMAQPLGLHTLGQAPELKHRLATVLLMLGQEYWEAAAAHAGVEAGEVDEALVADYEQLERTPPYALLKRASEPGADLSDVPESLRAMLEQGRKWYQDIGAEQELPALVNALGGGYTPTSYGGDPIKNPDAYPTGRNLYGFDPSRVPTPQAWEAGKIAAEELIQAHRDNSGEMLRKLALSLWSVETMRHQGLLEAQAFWLMGVKPVWDKGGRVSGVELVDRETLGRPRVDVVLSATGLYRDHFPNTLKQLALAAQLAALAEEPDNPVAQNAQAIAQGLLAQGVPEAQAKLAGQTRIFSSASGEYGTGLEDAALATDSWEGKEEGDAKLAALYLSKMQFAYGPDESTWGSQGVSGSAATNLYAEHLKGTQGAVLSRTSNVYGMLTTDDPFQYLGGLSLAVRALDGEPPELYISNLRGGGSGKVEGASGFLAKELATRQFHPGYIKGLMAEGYSGTLNILDATNNLWGWTAVAREVVRDDQWEEMADVYVRDKFDLGLKEWFEKENPHALAQTIGRMLEAARQQYWEADPATIDELKARYRDLAERYDVRTDNQRFLAYLAEGEPVEASQMPTAQPAPAPSDPAEQPAEAPPAEALEQVTGMRLDKVGAQQVADDNMARIMLALLLLTIAVGGARQAWRRK